MTSQDRRVNDPQVPSKRPTEQSEAPTKPKEEDMFLLAQDDKPELVGIKHATYHIVRGVGTFLASMRHFPWTSSLSVPT
jgi:hypothetical protein